MKRIVPFILVAMFIGVLFGCAGREGTSASWAYPFVKWQGTTYVITNEAVKPNQKGNIIGEVTKYSDQEGDDTGNFSNTLKKEPSIIK
ncbi:hypothetical protein ACFO4N_15785 [Camelliibacillus cellulosilyticus]|uniref:Lipoprotein n=1 Tax=Camelliibacillus cellulosilyticus TaxID=2174486 RepID=A0ABV9GQA3_9BACL